MAVDAERKAGGLFAELERGQGGQPSHKSYSSNVGQVESDYTATLESAGITMRDANRWQGAIPVTVRPTLDKPWL